MHSSVVCLCFPALSSQAYLHSDTALIHAEHVTQGLLQLLLHALLHFAVAFAMMLVLGPPKPDIRWSLQRTSTPVDLLQNRAYVQILIQLQLL